MTKKQKLKRKQWIKNTLFLLLLAISSGYTYLSWEEDHFTITTYNINTQKLSSDLKIVHLSDLHLKEFGENNIDLIAAILKESPDLIAITGDMCTVTETDYSNVIKLCEQLTKIAPVYYSLGNHEIALIENYSLEIKEDLENVGVIILDNQIKSIKINNDNINICGLSSDLYNYNGEGSILIDTFNQNTDFKLLLVHHPELFLSRIRGKYEGLALSGHAHGGQIILPFIGSLYAPDQGFLPKLVQGKHIIDNAIVIVSRGLGNHVKVPRINNKQELIIINVNANKN